MAGRRGGVRAGLWASRRRALGPDRVCHAESKGARSLAVSQKSVRARSIEIAFHCRRSRLDGSSVPILRQRSQPEWAETQKRLGDAPAA